MEQGLYLCAFTELLSHFPGLHWWQSKQGDSYAFAPACQTFIGSDKPLDPATWHEYIHPHDRPRRKKALQLTLGQEKTLEYRLLTEEGDYQWIQESIRFVDTADSGPAYLSTATSCKAPAFHSLFNNTSLFLALLDTDGVILESNNISKEYLEPAEGSPLWESTYFSTSSISNGSTSKVKEAILLAAQGQQVKLQTRTIIGSNTRVYGDFVIKPLFDEQQHLAYLMLEGRELLPERMQHQHNSSIALAQQAKVPLQTNTTLRSIIEGSDDLICAVDKDYRLIAFNTSFKEEIQQIYGIEVSAGFPLPDLPENVLAAPESSAEPWNRALQGEEFTILQEYNHPYGKGNPFETTFSPIRNEAGELIGAFSRRRDVSKINRIEKELKDAQEFLMLAENLPQIIFTAHPNGQIDYLNKAFFDYTNQTYCQAEQLDWKKVLHPEDYHTSLRQWLAAFKSNTPGIQLELRLRSRHGLYRWHIARAVPIYDKAKAPTKWVGVLSDIHEAKIASERERMAAQEFQTIAESLPHMVWTTKADGRSTYFNHKWYDYTGEAPRIFEDINGIKFIHPEDQVRTQKAWNRALGSNSYYQIEYRLRHKSGRYRWFLARGVPVTDAKGNVTKWFGTCTDIHENKLQRKRLQTQNERLHQINQYLDNFVHAAAHDLRSPIANMKGLLQLLRSHQSSSSNKLIESMETSLYRLDNTLQAMIHSIELQSLKQSPAKALNLEVVFKQVHQEFKERLQHVPHEIYTDLKNCPELVFIPFYLESLFRNLLSNAIKYRKENQKLIIHISCRTWRRYKLLEFSDNGIGIDVEKYRDKLFRPFQRFTQQAGGKGIGLHLINNIVTKTGGKIEVKSKPGQGTTFLMYLKDLEA